MTAPNVRVVEETSETIRIARIVCIFFMMTVHVWPGASLIAAADVPRFLAAIHDILINHLGRGSVALLSVISGYLFAVSLFKGARNPIGIALRKFRTLLVPMMRWSLALLLLLDVCYSAVMPARDLPIATPLQLINAIFALTAPPANAPLGFLRDIFVCVLLYLGASRILRHGGAGALAMLAAINLLDFVLGGVIVLRPAILTFFILGAVVAIRQSQDRIPGWRATLVVRTADAMYGSSSLRSMAEWGYVAGTLPHRFAIALLMWNMSQTVLGRTTAAKAILLAIEPAIFLIFCSHVVTIAFWGRLLNAAGVTPSDVMYPVLLLLQLLSAVVVGVALRRLIPGQSSASLKFLTGVRTA